QALGFNGGGGTTVENGAALNLDVDTGFDAHGRDLSNDSVTGQTGNGPPLGLKISTNISLNGTGIGGTGALHSLNGSNVWARTIGNNGASIGVEPDPNPSNPYSYFTHAYSLTVTGPTPLTLSGAISGFNLTKVDAGQLILPTANG